VEFVFGAVKVTAELLSRTNAVTGGPKLISVIATVPYTATLVPLKENCAIAPFDLVPCSDVLYSWETPAKDQSPVKTILGSRSSTIA
jgi:hypothetical protein